MPGSAPPGNRGPTGALGAGAAPEAPGFGKGPPGGMGREGKSGVLVPPGVLLLPPGEVVPVVGEGAVRVAGPGIGFGAGLPGLVVVSCVPVMGVPGRPSLRAASRCMTPWEVCTIRSGFIQPLDCSPAD